MPPELPLAVYGESPPQGHAQAVRALVEQARATHLR